MNIIVAVIIIIAGIAIAFFLITSFTGAPYVPTLKPGLRQVFKRLYHLSPDDLLIDLGAGDGVVLREATKYGAKALGIELNPILVLIMKFRFRKQSDIQIKCSNFYNMSFPPETTVVYTFAVSPHINPIYQKIQSEANHLHKTIYFISNAFELPQLKPEGKVSSFYLYKIKPEHSK